MAWCGVCVVCGRDIPVDAPRTAKTCGRESCVRWFRACEADAVHRMWVDRGVRSRLAREEALREAEVTPTPESVWVAAWVFEHCGEDIRDMRAGVWSPEGGRQRRRRRRRRVRGGRKHA